MKVTFWGVRGSVPAPGPETVRYGGNTACVELRTQQGELFVLDAGTGLIPLGRQLMGMGFATGKGSLRLFLSHLHWDHIQGFPFFVPVFIPGTQVSIFGPGRSSAMLEGILEGQMNPHFSPLHTMKNLGATIEVIAGTPTDGPHERQLGTVRVRSTPNPHGVTTALAFRFEEEGRSVVYAGDVGYTDDGLPEQTRALYAGADLLIHDATYSPEDQLLRRARGYSSCFDAASAAIASGVKRLALFHYDQDYTDDFVDGLVARTRQFLDERGGKEIELIASCEGLTVEV